MRATKSKIISNFIKNPENAQKLIRAVLENGSLVKIKIAGKLKIFKMIGTFDHNN